MDTSNDSRVTARVPSAVKETLEQAAARLGMPLNQFRVQASLRAARKVISREQSVRLSRRDVRALFDYLDNPPPANDALRNAARRYGELTQDSSH